jgi:hypothetical protein
MTPTTTSTSTSRPQQKLRLSIIQQGQNQRQRPHQFGKANKGASQRIGPPRQVQLATQRARPHNPQQMNVIRVTAPANQAENPIQFDRMQMKHGDRERSRVLAKLDRPGQWGILTGIQKGLKTTDERKTATTTTRIPGGQNAQMVPSMDGKIEAEINAGKAGGIWHKSLENYNPHILCLFNLPRFRDIKLSDKQSIPIHF